MKLISYLLAGLASGAQLHNHAQVQMSADN